MLDRVRISGHRERHKKVECTGIHTKRTLPQKKLAGKMRGDDFFISFCNQQISKNGVLEVHKLGWDIALRVLLYSCKEGRQATL